MARTEFGRGKLVIDILDSRSAGRSVESTPLAGALRLRGLSKTFAEGRGGLEGSNATITRR